MKIWKFSLVVVLIIGTAGCGKKSSEGQTEIHEQMDRGKDEIKDEKNVTGVQFKEGKGLWLPDKTKASIGLETVDVSEQKLDPQIRATAQVYRQANEKVRATTRAKAGFAYASALVNTEIATQIKIGQNVKIESSGKIGEVIQVDNQLKNVSQQSEVLLEIQDSDNLLPVGTFLQLRFETGGGAPVTAIPKSALLRAADGNFVYVVNGDHFLRTAVKTGAEGEQFVEVTDGLYPGDRVISKPVEAIWLIELRATIGGGGCSD